MGSFEDDESKPTVAPRSECTQLYGSELYQSNRDQAIVLESKSMTTLKSALTAAVALAMLSCVHVASAQTFSDQAFNYPSSHQACGNGAACGSGIGHGNFRAKLDHYSALNEKVRARSDAWPKPFACWDRQAYHSIWGTMLASGQEQQCVLSEDFFNKETQELNRVGISRIQAIMLNVAEQGRTVYVQESNDAATNEARMQQVKNTIDNYYNHLGVARIALTRQAPTMGSAFEADFRLESRRQSMTPPMIQAGTAQSVQQSVTQ